MFEARGNTHLARRLVWFAAFVNVTLLLMLCSLASMGSGWLLALLLMVLVDGPVALYAYNQGLFFEWKVERTWKAVCGGLGGNFKGEGMSVMRSARAGVASRGRYHVPTQTKTIYPKLRHVHGTPDSWTGIVTPFAGQTIEDYSKKAESFALAFHVPFVTFDLSGRGLIQVRAGQVPVPVAYDHPGQLETRQDDTSTRLLSQAVPVVPNVWAHSQGVPSLDYELALLRNVPMARDLNGRVCRIPIESNHWFIAARTNGGKGSWIWSLVLGLEPAWKAGLVKFWGIDPKMIELAIGRDWFEHYADDDVSSVELLEQCVKDMHERARKMQGITRKFTPSVETPLNVVIVDEMGYLSVYMPDKRLRERADKAIAAILSQGRAPGFALVGALQDPRKETCGFRDLFSIKIAGGLPGRSVSRYHLLSQV
jgi:hypothetical protein